MNNLSLVSLFFVLSFSACGSTPPPMATNPTPVPSSMPRLEMAVAPVEPPLSDTAPSDMSAHVHAENLEMSWKNSERLLRVLGVGGPGVTPELVAMGLLGPSIASVVDLAGPVDLAFFGKDFDKFALSVPVAPEMQPRLGKMFNLRPYRGLLKVTGASEDEGEHAPGALGACAFVGVEDESGARVVCAADEPLLESAGLYLGRTVMRESREGDVRLDVMGQQIFSRLADESADPTTNDWAEKAGEQYALGFFRDIEQLSLLGSWGKSHIDAEAVLDFRTKASGFSQAISARVPLNSPSIASFARLPKDSIVAAHGHAGNAQALVPMRDQFLQAFRADMEGDGYDSAMLDSFNQQVSALFFTGGSFAFAYGIDRPAAEKALAAYAKDKKKPALRATAFKSLRGWAMYAVDEPPEKWTKGIEDLVRVGNELDRKRNGGTTATSATPVKGRNPDDRTSTSMAVVAAPAALPKGSLHVEIRTKPLKTDAPPAYTKHLYVVPDGSRTWIGIGEDEAPMLARLRASREGLTEQTIAGVPELANAASQGAVAAGYFSLAGGTLLFLDDDRDAMLDKAIGSVEELASLPGHGDGIIPWQITSEDAQKGGGRARMKAKFSLPVLGDIAEMARK